MKELLSKSSSSRKRDGEDVVNELLSEIGLYSQLEQESFSYQESFISMIKFYSRDSIQKDFEDMVIGFNLLNLTKVSIELFKRVDVESLNEKEAINYYYLKIETLLKAGEYYRARDLSEDILFSRPLVNEEQTTFSYLRAESYYFLNQFKIAKALFQEIREREDNYRLTEERITEIEKDK